MLELFVCSCFLQILYYKITKLILCMFEKFCMELMEKSGIEPQETRICSILV